VQFAVLLANNPEGFQAIVDNNVTLFHGTNGNALPSILKYGLKSGKELENDNIPVTTGEAWSRRGSQRSFISFTDYLGTALSYAAMPPSQDSQEDLSFGVLVGLSAEAKSNLHSCPIISDLVELGFIGNIPLEYIKVLIVPKDKVEYINKIIDRTKIQVLSLENLDEHFYFRDSLNDYDFEINTTSEFEGSTTTLDSEAFKKISSDRKLSNIHKIFGKVQKFFKEIFIGKGENDEQNLRNE